MRAGVLVALLLGAALAGCIGATDTTTETVEPASVEEAGFSGTHVFPGEYNDEEPYSLTLAQGPFEMLEGQVEYLSSEADGVDIQIGVVRPDVPEGTQVPVIAFASPYMPPLQEADLHDLRDRLTDNFVQHGYAVAFIAVRGTADSGGCIELFGENETQDLSQAVTWLGTQPWSNGNVGMIGVSYDGSTPWMVAGTGNPHLKTIVPISGLSDVFQLEYRNGTVETRMLGLVSAAYYTSGFLQNNPENGRSAQHVAEGVVCPDTLEGITASFTSAATGERDPLGYWEERNHRPEVEANYQGSIFLVHGLQDWNVDPHHAYPWVNQLEDQGFLVKHLLGQWGHAWPDGDYLDLPTRRLDFAEILLHWFDHELKEDTSVDLGPRVQVQDSSGQWRSAEAWPPEDSSRLTLHLNPGMELAEAASDDEEMVPMTGDETLVTGEPMYCAGCARFDTGALADDLRFAGQPKLHVTVTPSAPGGTVTAYLYAVDGEDWTRLGWTQMDLRFHAGGETAQTVTPGEPIVAKMQLEPLDVHVEAGTKLVLLLNTGSQHDRLNVGMGAPVALHAGGEQSTLSLDTFTVAEDRFFDPPE
ncbi:MAG: CocE/NonD family hydrolase [Candidatus Thermoplasmatota archaeon]|nr:CocE/NonD family hydrolase [Candidatus Thermoplasmatota archaeon]